MKRLLFIIVSLTFASPAMAQDVTTLADGCTALCGEFEALSVNVQEGQIVGCVCDAGNPSRVCCTQGESVPCGDACIATTRTCNHEEPGRAQYCDAPLAGPYVDAVTACADSCEPYEVGYLELDPQGTVVACGCAVDELTPVCCTPEVSQPCGNGCIPLGRNCHQEPGRAQYCPEEPETE